MEKLGRGVSAAALRLPVSSRMPDCCCALLLCPAAVPSCSAVACTTARLASVLHGMYGCPAAAVRILYKDTYNDQVQMRRQFAVDV